MQKEREGLKTKKGKRKEMKMRKLKKKELLNERRKDQSNEQMNH